MKNKLMKSLCLLVVIALGVGMVSAGCGTKATHQGTLSSVGEDGSSIVITVDGKDVTLSLTEATKVMDADGNEIEVGSLVGEKIKVVSEHAQIDSIEQLA